MESAHEHGDRNLEEVAASAAWVRRLAVALTRDVHAGEDIAQDALLAAVRDHRSGRDVRGWLFGIVQNLTRMRSRSDDRRESRERRAARSEGTVDPVLALERLELQESLLGAVRELPEPYRTAVVLRWFEELAPEEIARRTCTPVRTVHTRLQRALRSLRETLDRRAHGDRSRWLAAWVPAIPKSAPMWPWILAMQLKTKAAVAVLSIGAVLSLWFVVDAQQRPAERSTALANEPAQLATENAPGVAPTFVTNDGKRSAIETPAGSSSNHPVATTTGLTVRSSIGLEFTFFEWRTPVGDWRRQNLEHGRCATTEMQLPCSVRAPGHVPAKAEKDGDEIVLDPDELLIIEGDDLRSCTSSIRIHDPYREIGQPLFEPLARACVAGFLSPTQWAMAVSHDLIQDASSDGEATAVVIWRDQHRADVHLHPIAGVRARWTLPCDNRPACAPLELRVKRLPAVSPPGRIALRATPGRIGALATQWETFEWGNVAKYSLAQMWVDPAHVESNASEFIYPALPLGEPLLVFARDEVSGAYGRVEFLHDGSSQTIELRSAVELIVRLVSAVDSSPVRDARVLWTFPGEAYESLLWSCTDGRTLHSDDGVFRRLLPDAPLLHATTPLEPPSPFVLRVEAAGFEPFEKTMPTGGGRQIDCGEVRLTPQAGQVVLAPGHGLEPKSVEWMCLRSSGHHERSWNTRNAALGADGSMGVFLVESDESTRAEPLFDSWDLMSSQPGPAKWSTAPSRWLVVHALLSPQRDEDRLFERRADGLYAAVPTSELELVLECGALPPGDATKTRWTVGWIWRDQWGQLTSGPPRVGEVRRVIVSIPADGASLYWSAKGTPPGVHGAPLDVGGTIPVASLSGKLILR